MITLACVIYILSGAILWMVFQENMRLYGSAPTLKQLLGHYFVMVCPVLNTLTIALVGVYAVKRWKRLKDFKRGLE